MKPIRFALAADKAVDGTDEHVVAVFSRRVPRAQRTKSRLYIYLALLQLLDICTTAFLLHHYTNAAEGNPIAKFVIDAGWIGFPVLSALKFFAVYWLWATQGGVKIVSSIYSLVIANNLLFVILHFTT